MALGSASDQAPRDSGSCSSTSTITRGVAGSCSTVARWPSSKPVVGVPVEHRNPFEDENPFEDAPEFWLCWTATHRESAAIGAAAYPRPPTLPLQPLHIPGVALIRFQVAPGRNASDVAEDWKLPKNNGPGQCKPPSNHNSETYMAALIACRCNPELRAFHDRLAAADLVANLALCHRERLKSMIARLATAVRWRP